MLDIKIQNPKFKSQKSRGVSLYLAFMTMTILLALALGVSAILVGQIKMIRGMGNSVIAFYAADTGIERVLKEGPLPEPCLDCYLDLNNNGFWDGEDSAYSVRIIQAGQPGCPSPPASYNCIKSVGIYKETKRAIEITR